MKKNRYVIGVILSVAVLGLNQFFIQYWLHKKDEDSKVINIAGRQRMLSQKINLEFYQLAHNPKALEAIQTDFNRWEQVHHALLHGDSQLGIHQIDDQPIQDRLTKLNSNIELIRKFLHASGPPSQSDLQIINENQAGFLQIMEDVVKKLEISSDIKLHFIAFFEVILAIVSIIIISLEVKFIYQPIEKKLKKVISELISSKNNLRAVLDSTTESIILISTDFRILNFNKQANKNCQLLYQKPLYEGTDLISFLPEKERLLFMKDAEKTFSGELVCFEKKFKLGGKESWFEIGYFPAYDAAGKLMGITFCATNLDYKKQSDQVIAMQSSKLQKIAWQHSHEIRRPLANILIFLDLLKSDTEASEAEREEYFELLSLSTRELDEVIQNVVNHTAEPENLDEKIEK